MADITTVNAAGVKPTSNTVIVWGTAGATITAGQPVYADPADSYKLKPAASTNQTQAKNVVGIALNGASADQPVAYASSGDVTFAFTSGSFTAATVYVLGNGTGLISPSADLDSSTNTRYGTVLGIAASTTNLRLGINISDVLNP